MAGTWYGQRPVIGSFDIGLKRALLPSATCICTGDGHLRYLPAVDTFCTGTFYTRRYHQREVGKTVDFLRAVEKAAGAAKDKSKVRKKIVLLTLIAGVSLLLMYLQRQT